MIRECWFADDYGLIPSGMYNTYRRWTRALCHGLYPFTDGDDHYPVAVVERSDGTLEQVSIELVRMIGTGLVTEPSWVIQAPEVKPRDWRRLMTEVLEPPQCGTPWLQEVTVAKATFDRLLRIKKAAEEWREAWERKGSLLAIEESDALVSSLKEADHA